MISGFSFIGHGCIVPLQLVQPFHRVKTLLKEISTPKMVQLFMVGVPDENPKIFSYLKMGAVGSRDLFTRHLGRVLQSFGQKLQGAPGLRESQLLGPWEGTCKAEFGKKLLVTWVQIYIILYVINAILNIYIYTHIDLVYMYTYMQMYNLCNVFAYKISYYLYIYISYVLCVFLFLCVYLHLQMTATFESPSCLRKHELAAVFIGHWQCAKEVVKFQKLQHHTFWI